jgi:hypothetical protein
MKSYLKNLMAFPAFDGGIFHFGPDVVESLFRDEEPSMGLTEMAREVTTAFDHFVKQGRFPDQVAFRFGDRALLVQAQPLHDEVKPGTRTDSRSLFLDNLFLTISIRNGQPIAPLLREGRTVLAEAAKEALAP